VVSNKKRNLSARELVEANRDKMLAWNNEGRSYFWMAGAVGLNDRNAPAVLALCNGYETGER